VTQAGRFFVADGLRRADNGRLGGALRFIAVIFHHSRQRRRSDLHA